MIAATTPMVSKAEMFPLQGTVVVVLLVTSMVELGAMGKNLLLVVQLDEKVTVVSPLVVWYESPKVWWSTFLGWESSFFLRSSRHRKQAQ